MKKIMIKNPVLVRFGMILVLALAISSIGHRKMLEQLHEPMPLLARDNVDLRILRDAGQAHEHRDHGMACEVIERILKVAVGVFLKIAQDARVPAKQAVERASAGS